MKVETQSNFPAEPYVTNKIIQDELAREFITIFKKAYLIFAPLNKRKWSVISQIFP